MSFKPTAQQEEIKRVLLTGANIMVQAYAGCSKTTTMAFAAKAYSEAFGTRRKKLAVAFNVRAKKELEERLVGYDDWSVKTFNALGFGVLRANPRSFANLNVRPNKVETIINGAFERLHASGRTLSANEMTNMSKDGLRNSLQTKVPDTDEMKDFIFSSIEACKTWGVRAGSYTLNSMTETLVSDEDTLSSKFDAVKNLDLMPEAVLNRIINNLLDVNLRQARDEGIIDYNDQIYLSVLYCENKGPQWPVVIVDEVQDTSKLNIQQIQRATTGQVCGVGDKFQRIYQFRGAYDGNMEDMAEYYKTTSLSLSKTFRCPVEVVHRSRLLIDVKDFESFNPKNQGTVQQPFVSRLNGDRFTWDINDIVRAHVARKKLNPDHRTVILSKRNKDCQALLALLLRAEQVQQSQLPLEHIGWSSNPLYLNNEFFRQPTGKLIAQAAREGNQSLADVVQRLKEPEPGKDNYQFVVSTVHRFKGLEADDVYIFNPDALIGDTNLNYVAQTRTRDRLAFLYLPAINTAGWQEPFTKAWTEAYTDWTDRGGWTEHEIVQLWLADKQFLLKGTIKEPALAERLKKKLVRARKLAQAGQTGSLGTIMALGPLKRWQGVNFIPIKRDSPAPVEASKPAKTPEKAAKAGSDEKFLKSLLT